MPLLQILKEFDKDRDFVENESETSESSVDQIFTGENKKKLNFLPFSGFTCFINGIFPGLWVNYWFCYHTYLAKNLRCCPWLVYIWSFHWVMVIHTYFCTKGYDYVKLFICVLVLLVINTGCPKNLLKMGNTALSDFQFKLWINGHINMCTRGDLCSSYFLAIFLKHPVWRLVLM